LLPCLCSSLFAAVVLVSCIWMPVREIASVLDYTCKKLWYAPLFASLETILHKA